MSPRSVLALVAAPGTSGRAVPLLGLLALHADVISWHRRDEAVPDAVLATTVGALEAAVDRPSCPTAVWVRHHDEIDRAAAAGATVLLTPDPELAARGAVLVPPVGIEVDRWPAVAPLVRARWRARSGLPDDLVVLADAVEGDQLDELLRVAAAVVVSGPRTLVALALAAPIVTSAETARRLGLRPGRDVEVAEGPEQAAELAAAVAADEGRAAALSRRARRCAEHHLDLGRPARTVAEELGLVDPAVGQHARLDRRLDELGTPPTARARVRAAAALAGVSADGGGSTP